MSKAAEGVRQLSQGGPQEHQEEGQQEDVEEEGGEGRRGGRGGGWGRMVRMIAFWALAPGRLLLLFFRGHRRHQRRRRRRYRCRSRLCCHRRRLDDLPAETGFGLAASNGQANT